MKISKLIKTESEYNFALVRIEKLMAKNPELGTANGDELDLLVTLVDLYEKEKFPIENPSPVEAIKFSMEQMGLAASDLAPLMGGKSHVSEVLSGKRPLSLSMIRNLSKALHIPAEILIQETAAEKEIA